LGIALLVSVVSRRKATALGAGIFIWFIFSVISDSALLAPIFSMAGRVEVVLPFILLNPVESARLLVLSQSVHSFVYLGASGTAVKGAAVLAVAAVVAVALYLGSGNALPPSGLTRSSTAATTSAPSPSSKGSQTTSDSRTTTQTTTSGSALVTTRSGTSSSSG